MGLNGLVGSFQPPVLTGGLETHKLFIDRFNGFRLLTVETVNEIPISRMTHS